MKPSKLNHFMETQYGFQYGQFNVERTCRSHRWGYVITLETDKERLEVRSTLSGIIRVGKPIKKLKTK